MMLRLAALALALLAPSVAHADWHEASTEHFVVYADDRPDAITKFAGELEKFNAAMTAFYPQALAPAIGPANRVTVFVLSGNGVEKLVGDKFTRGFYIPRAGANVAFVPRVSGQADASDFSGATVLRHEYAHHFMYTRFSAVFPIWFSEGFAEFWSTVRFNKDGSANVGMVPQHRAYGLLAGNPLPVDQLLTLTDRKLSEPQREAIYGRGWLLTHYLTVDPARQKLLNAYINAINTGQSLIQASQAFGDLKLFAKAVDKYMRGSIPAFRLPADRIATKPVVLRKLTPGEVALMPVRVQSRAGVDAKEAQTVMVEARKAAAPFPADTGAQTALAEAEFDAGNHALAEAAAARAIAADPKNSEALVYRAMARFEMAAAGNKPDDWKEVRRAILAANRADPEDPRPLILFYRVFHEMGEVPTANAKAGFAKAYHIAPSDLGLRMNAAMMFVQDKKLADAREALRLVAYHPHAGGMSERARAMIAGIERGDSPEKILRGEAPIPAED